MTANSWMRVFNYFRSNNEPPPGEHAGHIVPAFAEEDLQVQEIEVLEGVEMPAEVEILEQEQPLIGVEGGAQNVVSPLMKSMRGLNML